jgi:hypothetical protein
MTLVHPGQRSAAMPPFIQLGQSKKSILNLSILQNSNSHVVKGKRIAPPIRWWSNHFIEEERYFGSFQPDIVETTTIRGISDGRYAYSPKALAKSLVYSYIWRIIAA